MISFEPFGRFTGHLEAPGPHCHVDSVWRACEVPEKVEGTDSWDSTVGVRFAFLQIHSGEPTCAFQHFLMTYQYILLKMPSHWKSMSCKRQGTDNSWQQHEQNTPLWSRKKVQNAKRRLKNRPCEADIQRICFVPTFTSICSESKVWCKACLGGATVLPHQPTLLSGATLQNEPLKCLVCSIPTWQHYLTSRITVKHVKNTS